MFVGSYAELGTRNNYCDNQSVTVFWPKTVTCPMTAKYTVVSKLYFGSEEQFFIFRFQRSLN